MSKSSTNSCDKVEVGQKRRIKPTRRSVSGKFPFKGVSTIPYESTLERDFLERQNFFLNVADVVPQPVEIPFVARNGRTYEYTPDFLLYHRLGCRSAIDYHKPILVEVKYAEDWRDNWRKWLPKWKAAYRLCLDQGWLFHIYDESRIRDQALQNIQFLKRFRKRSFDQEDINLVINSLRELGFARMDYLLAKHFKGAFKADGIALIWYLLATRKIDCDIHAKLNESTVFWVVEHV